MLFGKKDQEESKYLDPISFADVLILNHVPSKIHPGQLDE